jgi:heme a synthase
LTLQFIHRGVAYLLILAAALHALDLRRAAPGSQETGRALLIAVALLIQAALGILTLVHVVPIGLALAHQAMAMIVLALAAVHAARLNAAATVASGTLATNER